MSNGLEAKIVEGRLMIWIGVDQLCFAVEQAEGWPDEYKITNNKGFARDILAALLDEAEDGTHALHLLLDAAAEEAVNQGSQHIEARKCKHCGCTWEKACKNGCHWHDDKKTVCSNCAEKEKK